MNEQQLRQKVADTINAWVGSTRGSAGHREILQIYNAHTPLARGYRVQQGDAYCATTVSAAWIKCGIAEYTGTECSVGFLTAEAMKRGIWIERDDYVPKLGDAVCYDWQDSGGNIDNTGWPDHIGIVTEVHPEKGYFRTTEGNMSGGKVDKRDVPINWKYLRGFICPKYAEIAAVISPKEEVKPVAQDPWYITNGELAEAKALGITDGTRPDAPATRAEVAAMVLRAIKIMKEGKA